MSRTTAFLNNNFSRPMAQPRLPYPRLLSVGLYSEVSVYHGHHQHHRPDKKNELLAV